MVFEASFSKAQVLSDYDTGNNNNVVFGIILPCVGAAVALLIIFLILNRIVRKRGGWKVVCGKIVSRIRTSSKAKKDQTASKQVTDAKTVQSKNKRVPKSASAQAMKRTGVPAQKRTVSKLSIKRTSVQAPKSTNTQQTPKK